MIKFKRDDKKKQIAGGVGVIAGGKLLEGANKEGNLTGRVTLYHNTKTGLKGKILQEGLKGSKTLDPESYTNQLLGDLAKKDGRELVYTAKKKSMADGVGRYRKMYELDHGTGETLKIKLPYGIYKKNRVLDNPELARIASIRENPDTPQFTKDIYKRLERFGVLKGLDAHDSGGTRIIEGNIAPEYLVESKKYKRNGMKEWTRYVKENPKHFAKGAGKVALGTGLIAGGAYLIGKSKKKKEK